MEEYRDLEARAEALDSEKLKAARLSLRPEEEQRAVSKLENAYGKSFDHATMCEAKNQVSDSLGEGHSNIASHSLRENLKKKQKDTQQREQINRKKPRDRER